MAVIDNKVSKTNTLKKIKTKSNRSIRVLRKSNKDIDKNGHCIGYVVEFKASKWSKPKYTKASQGKLICPKRKILKRHTETKPKENVVKESKSKNKCSCCIKNNLLITSNIIYKKGGSVVKKNKKVRKIKAIVLHRTAGGTTAGAVRSKIGTTFYVDGPRGNDGQIFQSFSLLKRTNHIKSSKKYRIAKYDIKSYNSIGIEVIGYAYYKKDDILYKDIQGKPKQPNNTKLSKAYSNGDGTYYWDPLSSKQINSVVCIVKALMKKYSLSKNDILMHELIQGKTSGEGQCVMDAIKAKI